MLGDRARLDWTARRTTRHSAPHAEELRTTGQVRANNDTAHARVPPECRRGSRAQSASLRRGSLARPARGASMAQTPGRAWRAWARGGTHLGREARGRTTRTSGRAGRAGRAEGRASQARESSPLRHARHRPRGPETPCTRGWRAQQWPRWTKIAHRTSCKGSPPRACARAPHSPRPTGDGRQACRLGAAVPPPLESPRPEEARSSLGRHLWISVCVGPWIRIAGEGRRWMQWMLSSARALGRVRRSQDNARHRSLRFVGWPGGAVAAKVRKVRSPTATALEQGAQERLGTAGCTTSGCRTAARRSHARVLAWRACLRAVVPRYHGRAGLVDRRSLDHWASEPAHHPAPLTQGTRAEDARVRARERVPAKPRAAGRRPQAVG